MAQQRGSIDAGYILHGHGEPGAPRSGLRRWLRFGGSAALIWYGLARQRGFWRWLSVATGTAWAIGGISAPKMRERPRTRLGMMGAGAVEKLKEREWSFLEATVVVDRPLQQVYSFMRDVKNWPRIFTGVQDAQLSPDGELAWALGSAGGGRALWWRGRVTEDYPEQLISWESMPDSIYDETGSMRFEKETADATRVTLSVAFRIGSGAAHLLAGGVIARMTEEATKADLQVMKETIERAYPLVGTAHHS